MPVELRITGNPREGIAALKAFEQELGATGQKAQSAGQQVNKFFGEGGLLGTGRNIERMAQLGGSVEQVGRSIEGIKLDNLNSMGMLANDIGAAAGRFASELEKSGGFLGKMAPALGAVGVAASAVGVAIQAWNIGAKLAEITGAAKAMENWMTAEGKTRTTQLNAEIAAINKAKEADQARFREISTLSAEEWEKVRDQSKKYRELRTLDYEQIAAMIRSSQAKTAQAFFETLDLEERYQKQADEAMAASNAAKNAAAQAENAATTDAYAAELEQRVAATQAAAQREISIEQQTQAAVRAIRAQANPVTIIRADAAPTSTPGSPVQYAGYGSSGSGVVTIVSNVSINAGAVVDPQNVRDAATLIGAEILKQTGRSQL